MSDTSKSFNTYIRTTGNIYLQINDYKTTVHVILTMTDFNGKPRGLVTVTYPVLNGNILPEKKEYMIPEQWARLQDDIKER